MSKKEQIAIGINGCQKLEDVTIMLEHVVRSPAHWKVHPETYSLLSELLGDTKTKDTALIARKVPKDGELIAKINGNRVYADSTVPKGVLCKK